MSDEDDTPDSEWLPDDLPSFAMEDVSAALGGGLVTHWMLLAKIADEDDTTSVAYRASETCDIVTQAGLIKAVSRMLDRRL